MAAILTTKEDAQGVEEIIDPKNFYLWGNPSNLQTSPKKSQDESSPETCLALVQIFPLGLTQKLFASYHPAILRTKEDAQGVEENIDPKNFYLWGQPTPKLSQ